MIAAPFERQEAPGRVSHFQDGADPGSQTRPAVPGGRPLSQSVLPERERALDYDPEADAQSWQNEVHTKAASAKEAGAQ